MFIIDAKLIKRLQCDKFPIKFIISFFFTQNILQYKNFFLILWLIRYYICIFTFNLHTLMILKLFLIYLLIINIVTFVTYAVDKWRAVNNSWRVPESVLIWMVVAMGGVGALAGIWGLRHKTKHALFTIGVPAIMITEFLLFNMILYMITSSW